MKLKSRHTLTLQSKRTPVWNREGQASVDAPEIRDTIAGIEKLPTLPAVLAQVLDTVSNPEASALDLGQYIAADISLSASLLRLVNSAFYGFFREINTVTDAIVILGFSEVRNLVLAATAFDAFSGGESSYDRTQLWRHSLAVAIGADRTAKMLKVPGGGGHFVAGLLHDFGKVAFDTLYPEQFREASALAADQGISMVDAEQEAFNLNHGKAGGLLGEHWNLPPMIVDAVRHHHTPAKPSADPQLTQIIALSDYLAYQAGLGEPSNTIAPALPFETLAALSITEEQTEHLSSEVEMAKDRIDGLLSALPGAED